MSVGRLMLLLAISALLALGVALGPLVWGWLTWRFGEWVSIADRVEQFSARVDPVWQERCEQAGLPYPPARVRLVGLKREKRLEVYAAATDGGWKRLATYPVLAASGGPGPKLREGDGQVPEGLYRISLLNPNSRFHVSLRVDYPSEEDREQGRRDGRERLGGDIMIHGGRASVGCLAIGDPAIEEVFLLAERVGLVHLDALLLPHDLRHDPVYPTGVPPWMQDRYRHMAEALRTLPARKTAGD
jgi:hypothetical protein